MWRRWWAGFIVQGENSGGRVFLRMFMAQGLLTFHWSWRCWSKSRHASVKSWHDRRLVVAPHEEGETRYGAILTSNPSGRDCKAPLRRLSSLVYNKYTALLIPCTGALQSPAPRSMKRQQTLVRARRPTAGAADTLPQDWPKATPAAVSLICKNGHDKSIVAAFGNGSPVPTATQQTTKAAVRPPLRVTPPAIAS